jgi:hypothetical protein
MSTSKKITLSREMSDEERRTLIKKTFAGTIYETAGDLKVFTKSWNDAQDKLQAKWKAESESLGEKHDSYKITLSEKN